MFHSIFKSTPALAPAFLFLIAATTAAPASAQTAAAKLQAAKPTQLGPWLTCDVTFTDHGHPLPVRFAHVPAAITAAQQQTGLKVAASAGTALMLFAFDQPGRRPFWMKGVSVGLSVAFIDQTGRITQIERMAPNTTRFHWSRLPFVWAIEAPTPTFQQHGIRPGAHIQFHGCPALPGKEKPAI